MEQRHGQSESGQGVASERFYSPLLETQVKAEHNTQGERIRTFVYIVTRGTWNNINLISSNHRILLEACCIGTRLRTLKSTSQRLYFRPFLCINLCLIYSQALCSIKHPSAVCRYDKYKKEIVPHRIYECVYAISGNALFIN